MHAPVDCGAQHMPVLAVEVAPRDQALDHHLLTLDEDH